MQKVAIPQNFQETIVSDNRKFKKHRLYKAKILRNKIGVKIGKKIRKQLVKILHRFLQEGTEYFNLLQRPLKMSHYNSITKINKWTQACNSF